MNPRHVFMALTDLTTAGRSSTADPPLGGRPDHGFPRAAAQPARSLTGADAGAAYGRTAGWIQARTGMQSLRRISGDERLVDLGTGIIFGDGDGDGAVLGPGIDGEGGIGPVAGQRRRPGRADRLPPG